MNKRTITISAIMSILIIGMVSAGVVPFLSNLITGTVTVEGPVFYAASGNELLINEYDETANAYIIEDTNEIEFKTEMFEESLDFYPMNIKMSVNAYVVEEDIFPFLELQFGYIKNEDLFSLCTNSIQVTDTEEDIYEISCNNIIVEKEVDKFYYSIDGMHEDASYEIVVKEAGTKVEITAI